MIVRGKLTANFTAMPNAIFRDERLSADARGFMAYLLTCKDDWNVQLAALGKVMGTGKDKTQAIMRQLHSAGSVIRVQKKRPGSNQFDRLEYVVFDSPETRAAFMTERGLEEVQGVVVTANPVEHQDPQPENQAAAFTGDLDNKSEAAAVFSGAGKSGCLINTILKKPFREKASAEAGAKAPSVNAQIWKEGRALLKQSPSPANPSIIGKWLKRVPTPEGKEKLRAMMRAAVEAGTADPVAYVTAALAKEYPPPPDVKTFDAEKWGWIAKASIKTRDWSSAWGPPPGKRGCMMPLHLITTELTAALSARKIAA